MTSLPPVLKKKKRYIAFKVYCDGLISKKGFIDAVLAETLAFFGENLTSEIGLWVLEFDEEKKNGFLICNHKYKGEVIAALSIIDSISSQRASIQVLGVSGTIQSLKRKFLNEDTDMSDVLKRSE